MAAAFLFCRQARHVLGATRRAAASSSVCIQSRCNVDVSKDEPDTLIAETIDLFKMIGSSAPVVVYSNQTGILLQPELKGTGKEKVISAADKLMREYGPVYVGSSAGDINVLPLKNGRGYLVAGHCDSMLTFVSRKFEIEAQGLPDDTFQIGFYGRSKRDKDGQNAQVQYWTDLENEEFL